MEFLKRVRLPSDVRSPFPLSVRGQMEKYSEKVVGEFSETPQIIIHYALQTRNVETFERGYLAVRSKYLGPASGNLSLNVEIAFL